MKEKLSALADGELSEEEAELVFRSLRKQPELRTQWDACHLIGDALRETPRLHADLTSRVMESLLDEPVVLAPAQRGKSMFGSRATKNAMAIAASIAGVAVVSAVAWSGRQLQAVPESSVLASNAKAPLALAASNDMQEYLVAHQTHAPVSLVQGAPRYIRTVSVESERNVR